MKGILFALVVATTVDCCDPPRHQALEQEAELTKLCVAKGGIPITEAVHDDGGHYFQVLRQCAFPCEQRLAVEK